MSKEEQLLTMALKRRSKGFFIGDDDIIPLMERYCEKEDIPAGCLVTGVNYDYQKMGWIVRLSNTSFDTVPEGASMPLLTVRRKEND